MTSEIPNIQSMTRKEWFISVFVNDYKRAQTFMAPSQYATSLGIAKGSETPAQRQIMAEYMWNNYAACREADPFLLEDIRDGYRQYLDGLRSKF